MAAAVLIATVLMVITPRRAAFPLWWIFPVVQLVMLGALILADPGRIDRRSVALRRATLALIAVMTVANTVAGVVLIDDIISGIPGITPTILLGGGAAIWVTNIITFSLWYWLLDRGGPAERAVRSGVAPAFLFPEMQAGEFVPDDWSPEYVDYLYLGFTNASAFSPTDTLPITAWAKVLMFLQSALALVVAVMIIARAVNILN